MIITILTIMMIIIILLEAECGATREVGISGACHARVPRYTYIYIERERDRYMYIHTYIHTHTYICIYYHHYHHYYYSRLKFNRASLCLLLCICLWWIVDSCMASIAGQGTLSGFPCSVNNQLRTGADKGNPTVYLKQSIAMASGGLPLSPPPSPSLHPPLPPYAPMSLPLPLSRCLSLCLSFLSLSLSLSLRIIHTHQVAASRFCGGARSFAPQGSSARGRRWDSMKHRSAPKEKCP